jgi:hypothetical protein
MSGTQLDQIQLVENIGSLEGVSVDQLTRARLQFALGQNHTLMTQTQFADAKAATLLTLIGLLSAYVSGGGMDATTPSRIVLLALNAVVIALCLMTLTPRVPGKALRGGLSDKDRYSWPALASKLYGGDEHADFLRTAQASQLVMSVARSNGAIAVILLRKYTLLQIAFVVSILDVVASVIVAASPAL